MRAMVRMLAVACCAVAVGMFDPVRAARPLTLAEEHALKPRDSLGSATAARKWWWCPREAS